MILLHPAVLFLCAFVCRETVSEEAHISATHCAKASTSECLDGAASGRNASLASSTALLSYDTDSTGGQSQLLMYQVSCIASPGDVSGRCELLYNRGSWPDWWRRPGLRFRRGTGPVRPGGRRRTGGRRRGLGLRLGGVGGGLGGLGLSRLGGGGGLGLGLGFKKFGYGLGTYGAGFGYGK
ncbi:glycine, alanine and asparagine-rich protein-like [Schistocerca americana]|uniref:glycine, alanine and asparagine-rich protein-like n=1 Tax=Schistocerca americana TaxID=7009 RepID=UPI001F4F4BF0|nr:glycine, alanine and asparagine-rich protein-like [Schistocerca americana]